MKIVKLISSLFLTGFLFLFLVNSTFAANQAKFAWAKVSWSKMPWARYYNIYYKEFGDKNYKHSVPNIPSNATSYTITHLKRGVTYWYSITAVDQSGKEIWFTSSKKLNSVLMK